MLHEGTEAVRAFSDGMHHGAERRKMKTFRRWMAEGRMTEEDIRTAYESWRGHMRRGDSWRAMRRMDKYYKSLYT